MGIRKELRVKEALARQAEAAQRTPQQRLAILDQRLGKGVGAARERAKLAVLTKTAKEKAAVESLDPVNNFVIKIDGKPLAIHSISQIRRLAAQVGFDHQPIVKQFRAFKKGK